MRNAFFVAYSGGSGKKIRASFWASSLIILRRASCNVAVKSVGE